MTATDIPPTTARHEAQTAGTLRYGVARVLGTGAATASRLLHCGAGTTVGGRVMLAVDPAAVEHGAMGRRVAVITGTNGKSTTRAFLAAALATAGEVVSNRGGANQPAGLAAALAGRGARIGVLEVDEPHLPRLLATVRPEVAVLLNLSRDQLDRYAEVRRIAMVWRQALDALPGSRVVANADDPLVAWAAMGAEDVCWVSAGMRWRADAATCPACGDPVRYADSGWASACGLRRPAPQWRVTSDGLVDPRGQTHPFSLTLPGTVNRGNAAMAAAAASVFGVPPDEALREMSAIPQVEGRYAVSNYAGTTVRLLLAKNPAGWSEALEMVAPQPAVLVAAVNDHVADGHDPAWLWDVPFERLAGRPVVATGKRATDLAVRLRYAGVEHVRITDPRAALRAAAQDGPVEAIANYTVFRSMRRALRLG